MGTVTEHNPKRNDELKCMIGMDLTTIDHTDLEKLLDIISIWEVIRILTKSNNNAIDSCIEFLSFSKPVQSRICPEFDECIEKGIIKGRILFDEVIQIAHMLKNHYVIPKNDLMPDGSIIKKSDSTSPPQVTVSKSLYNKLLNIPKLQFLRRKIPFLTFGNYIMLDLINEGSVGKVHIGINKCNRKLYALKTLSKSLVTGDGCLVNRLKDEMMISIKLNHPNVVQTYEIIETYSNIIFVMEYCNGGDLITYIRKYGSISERTAKLVFKMILKGVKHVHSLNICHRDLKPENIFLKKASRDGTDALDSFVLKIGDFGAAVHFDASDSLLDTVGTMSYAAPEVLGCGGIVGYSGQKADVWSLGVVLYAMLFGQLPWNNEYENIKRALNSIINNKLHFPKGSSSESKDLIQKMLELSPNKRLSLNEVANHSWFNCKFIPKTILKKGARIINNLNIDMETII